jgi:DNA polymerase-1
MIGRRREDKLRTNMETLYLIDGSNLVYRAHFAMGKNPLVTSKGEVTSAIYGFMQSLLMLLSRENPEHVAVVFDRPEPTFRHQMYPEYKQTRDKMPDELVGQLPRLREVLEASNIPILELPGYEADDIMGTLALKAREKGLEVVLYTGDKDMMQLVQPGIRILQSKKGEEKVLDEAGVAESFGVAPDKVIEVLGLMGDTSDNVPGVPGVGPKTAIELVKKYGTLEEVLSHVEEIDKPVLKQKLMEFADQAKFSKELVTINTDIPMEFDWEALKRGPLSNPRLVELFRELEFTHLMKFLEAPTQQMEKHYRTITTWKEYEQLLQTLREAGLFALDLETTSIDAMMAEIVGMSFSWAEGEAVYVPAEGFEIPDDVNIPIRKWHGKEISKSLSYLLQQVEPLLKDDAVKKVGQNSKYDCLVLANYGVEVKGVEFDTMIAAYVLNPGARQLNLDALALEHLNYTKIPTEALIGKGKNQISMQEVPLDKISEYACEDADCAYRIMGKLKPKLEEEELYPLFQDIEMPLMPVLMRMEQQGVRLDVDILQQLSGELEGMMEGLERDIYALATHKFNINSPKQLAVVLFEELKLPVARKTKTGPSTDVDVLLKLARLHELPQKLLDYRQLTKLKNTYVDSLPKLVNPYTGRVHTSYNQTVAATGRLSSSDPNLQNIPIRTELGSQIRTAFVPTGLGWVLLSADYSQIELRIVAHLSQDKNLMESFKQNEDIHRRTAARVFGVTMLEVTPEMRRQAKAVNFGIIYGQTDYGLSEELGIPKSEAARFKEAYFNNYPEVKAFMEEVIEKTRKEGYAMTMLGRKRRIPEIHSDQFNIRSFAERTAINTPVQGTAADMIKKAMIRIHKRLLEGRFQAKMILQVHDELVFDAPEEEVDKLKSLVKEEMEGAVKLKVPVVVDFGVGKNWLEAH